MQELVKAAEAAGCYKLMLDCAEANSDFYAKCGLVRKEVQMVRTPWSCSKTGKLPGCALPCHTMHTHYPGEVIHIANPGEVIHIANPGEVLLVE